MGIVRKDAETKCIHDVNAGDCCQRGGSYLIVTDELPADSQERLCVNLNNGFAIFFNVRGDKAKIVIREE